MTSSTIEPGTLDVLASTAPALRALLGALPDAIVETPVDEGWSPRDVVAHLLSVEGPNFTERIRMLTEDDDPVLPNLDEGEALERSGYRTRPVGELIDEFERLRAENVARIRAIDPDALARTGQHQVAGEVSAADIVHHKAYHDVLHIGQVTDMLRDRLDPLRGNMQRF